MYTRRKIVMNLIMLLGEASSMQIQKLIFLYAKSCNPESEPYQFFPNVKGCYSLTLSNDYHAMSKMGILNYRNKKYSVSKGMSPDCYALDPCNEKLVYKIYNEYGKLNEMELAEITYTAKPFYAIRSEIVGDLCLPATFYTTLESIREKIRTAPRTIYTIGYEGKSIDNVIRMLLYKNIKILVDVRKNAFSMRREFSKSNLIAAMNEAGIEYIHYPEVGIESEKRNELLPDGRRNELFEWYVENTLPQNLDFVEDVSKFLSVGNVAFLCYEKNPADCHRSYLASFCSNYISLEHEVINL